MDHATEAKTLLVHYLGLAIGKPLTSDQMSEIDTIIDHVVDARADNEMSATETAGPWFVTGQGWEEPPEGSPPLSKEAAAKLICDFLISELEAEKVTVLHAGNEYTIALTVELI